MSIKINLGAWRSVFAVPSKIVDEGLKFADGVKLKVLLYVLRHADDDLELQARILLSQFELDVVGIVLVDIKDHEERRPVLRDLAAELRSD